MLNAWWEPLDFSLPEPLRGLDWEVELDTADPDVAGQPIDPGHRSGDGALAGAAARPCSWRFSTVQPLDKLDCHMFVLSAGGKAILMRADAL